MMRWFGVLFVLIACAPSPVPVDVVPSIDAGGCDGACARLRQLNCPEGNSTPEGASCEQVCRNTMAVGLVDIGTDCLRAINSCDEQDSCSVVVQ